MVEPISFDRNAGYGGTYFIEYLETPYTFEEAVARLYTLAGYDIFEESDGDKTSFHITCVYGGNAFSLYDYKEDDEIHIGGRREWNMVGFIDSLLQLMSQTIPTPYRAKCYYSDCHKYSWPPAANPNPENI